MSDMEKLQREDGRWRVLKALDAGRPYGLVDSFLWRVVADVNLPWSIRDLRRELSFLEGLRLVDISNKDSGDWMCELTSTGVQVIEYSIPAPAGIGRPQRF